MKITEITTVNAVEFPNLVHVQVATDEGVVGLGETFYYGEAVASYVHSVAAPLILGQDALDRTRINLMLEGYVGYSGSGVENRARSAIDIAMWDVAGQVAGMPIYDMIGGRVHDHLRAYNTCAGSHYVRSSGQAVSSWGLDQRGGVFEDLERAMNTPGDLAEDLLASGISAMKIWPFDLAAEANRGRRIALSELREAMKPIEAIRAAVGDRMDILVELHALWSPGGARDILRALADFGIYWVEDPIRADNVAALADLRAQTEIPIALGETLAGARSFDRVLQAQGADVLTLDVGWTGGLTEALKIVSLATTHGIWVAPHDCTGPVGLAIATHLSTASPTALVQETVRSSYFGWYPKIVEGGPVLSEGVIRSSNTPGLGVRLRQDFIDDAHTNVRTTRA
jgi:galactonate dehydratase